MSETESDRQGNSDRETGRHGRTERFSRIPIFSNYLEASEVETIKAITDELSYAEGDQIFAPGEENDGFYIVLSGRVEIRLPDGKDGGEYTKIAALSNRSVFGEMSFLRGSPRSAWAVATTATKLSKIRGGDFRALLEAGDLAAYKVIYNFSQLISTRLRKVESELLRVLEEVAPLKKETKLAELQEFRQKLFQEWSF